MIQRIQSLYLLLTTILAILFLSGEIVVFIEGINEFSLRFSGINKSAGTSDLVFVEKLVPLSIVLMAVPLFSLITIFLYKYRKLQMKLTFLLILLIIIEILTVAYYSRYIAITYNATFEPGIKLVIPVLMILFSILAYRGIRKDEDLVRSYDRLR